MRVFLLLFITVPAIEIGILLLSGKAIGVLPTVLLIIFTGVFGVYLARKQGLETMRNALTHLKYGQIPNDVLLDGICIFIGGLLLITPGFITDLTGFLLLIPVTREKFKAIIRRLMRRWIRYR
ncbi:membrane protein FxsA [Bacillus aquiflavi]|uniref:Membrane protein FxsA n=1 Tax=Bacillus aquiflavi TaxID=2672567 RepID=A0A6B3VWK1_9BACI|nr:FxsA family protein [Bacillus aquiflavi]MBA4537105.1 membrane protein FxsA [Bacillus aquiflavi]NEY81402.1 membrane protein FxsA [Bacillus aquiflavi]UAC47537.1 membrane protein FxsA [Bacillus aquiflavi]